MSFQLSLHQPFGATGDDTLEEGPERRQQRTLASQTAKLFRRGYALAGLSALIAAACLLAFSLWWPPQGGLVLWGAAVFSTQALLFVVVRAFKSQGRAALTQAPRWLTRYLATLALAAVCWGVAPWVLLGSELSHPPLMALTLALMGVAMTGTLTAGIHRASIVLWMLPVLAPLIVFLGLAGSPLTLVMAPLVLAFMLACLLFADSRLKLVTRELQTQLDNDALVRALRQQVTLVERANREKSRFLASASHDLRQPMHALGLFTATLEQRLEGTDAQPLVTNMIRSIDALEQSFTSMLDISKLDAGVVEPTLQTFPIRDLFRVLHLHCNAQAEERGLNLRFKAAGKVVVSDPHLLERVLSNLIHNAIRYTHEGGVTVLARSRRIGGAPGLSIEVWDTGLGIAEDELPKVFDEFYQVGNTSRDRSRGLGMGLAIVRRLVLLMGHELEVQSRPGRGTVFRILVKTNTCNEMDHMAVAADTLPPPLDESRTLLLIDDEEPIRIGMSGLLQSWGYQVLVAGTIDEACTQVRRHAGVIDMVLSDLRLANEETGIDAIERVRSAYGAPLPAMLITGETSPDEVKRIHESGHEVMFKPVPPKELYAALRAMP